MGYVSRVANNAVPGLANANKRLHLSLTGIDLKPGGVGVVQIHDRSATRCDLYVYINVFAITRKTGDFHTSIGGQLFFRMLLYTANDLDKA